ncbi:reverse transcriptase domain-containing protein, partial [Tanacetum coccineum]
TTNLKNDITNFQHRFDETFSEAWDRFKDLIRKCPHHGFSELHQSDTFYNALTQSDQDSLNAAAGGNLLNRTSRDALTIIENKSKVRILRNKPIVSKVSTTTSSPSPSPDVTALTEIIKEICLAADGNTFNASAATGTYNQGVQGYRPQGETNYRASNQMGPPGFPQPNVQNNQNRFNQNQGYNHNRGNNFNQGNQNYQASLNQTQVGPTNDFSNYMKTNDVNMRAMQNQISNMKTELKKEFQTTMLNQNNELKNDLKNMMSSFFQMQSPLGSGSLPSNTNANPRDDLKAITTRNGVSYNGPMIPPTSSPLSKEVERELEAIKDKLPKLTLTRMTLELANRSIAYPFGVAEYVFVKVGKFHFPVDFVVVDYDVDPRFPLILGRPFLRTAQALIDVYGEELTLRVDDEAITFNVRDTPSYSYKYENESVNRIDVIDVTCKEYAQEVLGFSDSSTSGNPTPLDPIIASSSPSFTPFEGGDFILEEIETFLHTPDNPSNLSDDYYDTEGDILYLEKLLNEDPSPNLPPMKKEDLKQVDVTMMKPSIEEPPELELKDLPPHLEYAFLEGNNKLPVIISKELKDEEKAALLTVLKSHKRAIAWKISDIKGIDPHF